MENKSISSLNLKNQVKILQYFQNINLAKHPILNFPFREICPNLSMKVTDTLLTNNLNYYKLNNKHKTN